MNPQSVTEITGAPRANMNYHYFRVNVMVWSSSLLKASKWWMIEKCVKDEDYRKEVFKEMDECLKKI